MLSVIPKAISLISGFTWSGHLSFIKCVWYNLPKENVTLMDAVSENIQYWLNKYPNAILISGGDFNMVLNRFR